MLKTLAIALGGTYASLLALGRLGYRKVLYPAPRGGGSRAPAGSRFESWLASDGQPLLAAVYDPVAAAAGSRTTVVLFHGNGETIADSSPECRALARRGLTVVAVEYRGYGTSPASEGPSEEGLYADAQGALSTLHDAGVGAGELTLWGRSLGTGVAVEMALRGHAGRLVLQAPYTSIPEVAARLLPFLPMGWIVGDRFDNASKVAQLGDVPTLILHGDQDGVVPYDMGVALAEKLPRARLLTVAGAGHNDLFAHHGEQLLDAIADHARGTAATPES